MWQALVNAFGRNARDIEELKQALRIIKLPVHLVTIGTIYDTTNTRRVMGLVRNFYADLDIVIQDSHSSRPPGVLLTYVDDSLSEWHCDNVHGPRLTIYVDPTAGWIGPEGNGWVGQVGSFNTVANGTAIIAGDNMDDYLAATIDHEIGHLLLTGENADHEQGTFMSAAINEFMEFTDAQREALRAGAYRWGSY